MITKERVEQYRHDLTQLWSEEHGASFKADCGVLFTLEESVGGEGCGDHVHIVLSVQEGDKTKYVKIDGYYNSYDGVDWTYADLYFVEPYIKSVRDWKNI